MRAALVTVAALFAVLALNVSPAVASHQGTSDRDCSNFSTQAAAQDYYEAHGGPSQDPDRLDSDSDGVACESNRCPCRGPGQNPQPSPDSDSDGVPDTSDACPTRPGSMPNGCPPTTNPPADSDSDGVPDSSDACPAKPGSTPNGCPPPPPTEAEVLRVIDGDTIVVSTSEGDVTVRLIGIDTPETRKSGTPVECGGREATKVMKRFARAGEQVTLTTDSTQDTFDRFGRLLAYVTGNNGRLLQVETLEKGWAKVYVFENRFKRYGRFRQAQQFARNRRVGLFRRCRGQAHRRL